MASVGDGRVAVIYFGLRAEAFDDAFEKVLSEEGYLEADEIVVQ